MKRFMDRHKAVWDLQFVVDALIGVVLLAFGLLATYYANVYTITHASNAVTDLILNNIPVYNVDFIFSEGATLFVLILIFIGFYKPKRIPFLLKSIGLFVIIRSMFLVLTHIAPPLVHSYQDPNDLIYRFSSGDDLFFSEHTGLPFMLAFIFWDEKYLRYFFFVASAIGGVAVLLGHLHYSIDVFSALFIGYGIYRLSMRLFTSDYKLLQSAPDS